MGGVISRTCEVCGESASFGIGVSFRRGQRGRWYCAKHYFEKKFHGMPMREQSVERLQKQSEASKKGARTTKRMKRARKEEPDAATSRTKAGDDDPSRLL